MIAALATLTAARDALARHDWEACHDLVKELSLEEPMAEAERLDLLADASWWLGRLEESIEARQAAHRIFESLGDHRRAGMCAVWLYQDHCLRARPAAASAWLQRARRSLDGDINCVEYGSLLLREAEAAHGGLRLDHAAELAEEARALGRQLTSADLEAEALQTLGRVLIDAGKPTAGVAHLDEAMLLAVEGRLSPYATGKVYCSLISACEELGDLRRAAEWTEATATWAAQYPFAIFPGICRVHHAVVLERQGALEDAEREATRACTELLGSHLPNAAAAYAEVGDIRRRLGQLERAEEAFSQAKELCGRACAGAALLRLAQGRPEEARTIIAGCLADEPAGRLGRARLLPAAVQVAVAADDMVRAHAGVEELESIADRFDTPMLHAQAALARGRVQLAEGDPAGAGETLQGALRRWQELEVPYEVATASTLLGEAQREAGDEDAAIASFAKARALFEQIGAHLDARGIDAAPRTPRPAGLTEREVEVLCLVAAGRSNKEIAARLHLSVKTVSRHLTNIFNKTDVSSRAAATAFAFEHRLIAKVRRNEL
ncbi:MAG TPA: LuxR C-terminal-related transcriptional regulator [Acidimicrobiales bacterium]